MTANPKNNMPANSATVSFVIISAPAGPPSLESTRLDRSDERRKSSAMLLSERSLIS